MQTDTDTVRVVFRKWKSNGGIIALFPDLPFDNRGNITSYEHVGQHGAASTILFGAYTVAAKPREYAELLRELKQIGYSLRVVTRR